MNWAHFIIVALACFLFKIKSEIIDCVPGEVCTTNCDAGEACTVNCDEDYVCRLATINCPASEDCTVNCQGFQSCDSATINCPVGGECNVRCEGPWACADAIINWGSGSLSCNGHNACIRATLNWDDETAGSGSLSCIGTGACREVQFPIPPPNDALDVPCLNVGECYGATIVCPTNATCNIRCEADSACADAIIKWNNPIAGSGSLSCIGTGACSNVQFPLTKNPTNNPTNQPTNYPTNQPTSAPTNCFNAIGEWNIETLGESAQFRFYDICDGSHWVKIKMNSLIETDENGKATKNKVTSFAAQNYGWKSTENTLYDGMPAVKNVYDSVVSVGPGKTVQFANFTLETVVYFDSIQKRNTVKWGIQIVNWPFMPFMGDDHSLEFCVGLMINSDENYPDATLNVDDFEYRDSETATYDGVEGSVEIDAERKPHNERQKTVCYTFNHFGERLEYDPAIDFINIGSETEIQFMQGTENGEPLILENSSDANGGVFVYLCSSVVFIKMFF